MTTSKKGSLNGWKNKGISGIPVRSLEPSTRVQRNI
jgi:hypothetical protein